MLFKNRFGFKKIIYSLAIVNFLMSSPIFAQNNIQQIDIIRAELNCIKDKKSPSYIKTQQKLNKLINQNKIDYSNQARFDDINRLIQEQKYNAAIYELNDLIDNNIATSLCYELLGDISLKSAKNPKKTSLYYKTAIQQDNENINALYKLAKLYLNENKNIIGIEYLKEIIEKTDDISVLQEIEETIKNKIKPLNKYEANILYEALGQIYVKTNNIEESFHAFNKALQLNPKDIFIKYYLGNLLYKYNDTTNANILFDSILQEYPQDSQIRISKAKLLFKEGNLLSANKEYLNILKEYPNSNSAKYGIFKIYENKLSPIDILKKINANKKDYIASKEDCLEFAKFLEEMNETSASQLYKNMAQEMEETQRNKIAQHFDKEIINEIKQEKELQKPQQKNSELKQEKHTIKAKQVKKQTTKTKTTPKLDKQEKQSKSAQKQEKLEAKKIEEKTNSVQENKDQENKLAKEKQQKEYEQKMIAQEKQKAITKDPVKYKEFQKIIEKYENTNPKNSQIYIAIANTYKQMGQPTSALLNYRKAQKLDPTNSDIYYSIGLTYMELNSLESAKHNLTKAINLDSENTKANNLLSFVNHKIITQIINQAHDNFESKKYIEALNILDNGIKKYPQNAQMYYYRALVCDAMNRNAAQIMDLQKAIELDPSYYMAYYQLGSAYEKINDERNALVAYEKFLSVEPDEKELIDEIQKKVVALGAKYY